MDGGPFILFGNAAGFTVQGVNRLGVGFFSNGASEVMVNANTGDGTVLNLGIIDPFTGSTVDFTPPSGTQSVTNGITTVALSNDARGIIGGYATVSGTSWATSVSNGNLVVTGSTASGSAVTVGGFASAGTVSTLSGTSATWNGAIGSGQMIPR